jgi:hypothetical protein
MADENRPADKQVPADQIEKRGMVQDVIVPIVQSGVGGAAAGWAAGKVGQGKQPPPGKKE